ncbi:hypothetical protein [Promicromonospora soli]
MASDMEEDRPPFAAEVRSHATGEAYGVGTHDGVTHASLAIEGNQKAVVEHPGSFRAIAVFDLPVALGLGEEPWSVPFGDINLECVLMRRARGQEQWTSTNTTLLPAFTHVRIKATPSFAPDQTPAAVKAVLQHLDRLLAAADQPPLQGRHKDEVTVRASFFPLPHICGPAVAQATIPLTGVVNVAIPDQTPITASILAAAEQLQRDLTEFVADRARNESFIEQVLRSVHDFGFYCRQHPETLTRLNEETIRDLLLVVQKHLFAAEGEAIQHQGKTDIKLVNPEDRYQLVVEELKFWSREGAIRELLQQGLVSHVTGQEDLIVLQVLSRNKDWMHVVDKVRAMVSEHHAVVAPFKRKIYGRSKEHLYLTEATVHGEQIPLALSFVNLYSDRRD